MLSAEAVANLLKVTPGCGVRGPFVEAVQKGSGGGEILGPFLTIQVRAESGRICWGDHFVTLEISRQQNSSVD